MAEPPQTPVPKGAVVYPIAFAGSPGSPGIVQQTFARCQQL